MYRLILAIIVLTVISSENFVQSEKPPVATRIIGGLPANPKTFPYHALLEVTAQKFVYNFHDGSYITFLSKCGGSLIKEDFVLTAAHCLYVKRTVGIQNNVPIEVNDMIIVEKVDLWLGLHDKTQKNKNYVQSFPNLNCRNFIIHEDYNEVTFLNDIALIKLPHPAKIGAFVKTINLPTGKQLLNIDHQNVVVAGFGQHNDNPDPHKVESSNLLRYVRLEILPNRRCFFNQGPIPASQICTNGQNFIQDKIDSPANYKCDKFVYNFNSNGGHTIECKYHINVGTCNGDSGGPLVIKSPQTDTVVGITSYGPTDNCTAGAISIFTRITSYLPWINKNING